MGSSATTIRRLGWTLAVLAIINGLITLGFAFNIGAPPPPAEDLSLVDRLLYFRADDVRIFGINVIQALAGLGVFLVAAILGSALSKRVRDTSARDLLAILFLVGGVIGVAANLVGIGVYHAATFGYCDCGFKTEEVIAQDYALTIGLNIMEWLLIGAVTLVGVGVAFAGRYIGVSSAWRSVSYLIAALLLIAAALRLLAAFVFVDAFDPYQISNLLTGLAAGILVPIWAILLARGVGDERPDVEPATMPA